MRLRSILLIGFFTLSTGLLCAQNGKDSLLMQVTQMPHDTTRLKALLAVAKSTQSDLERCRKYTDQLLLEAEQQHNDNYKCEAYLMQVLIAYNSYEADQLQATVKLLLPLARKEKRYDLLFKGWRCSVDFMILSQEYERNEKEALEMLQEARSLNSSIGILEAYQCLSNIYQATFRNEKAIDILEQALPLAIENGKISTMGNIWQPLLFLYGKVREYPKWIVSLNNFEHYLVNYSGNEHTMKQLLLLILNTSYTDYYQQIGDLAHAKIYQQKAKNYLSKVNSPLYILYYNNTCANFFYKMQDYDKALERIEAAREGIAAISHGQDYHTVLEINANILKKLNRYSEAIPLYKQVIAFKDTLQISTIDKQHRQLEKDFNTGQLLMEQGKLRHHRLLYMLGLLCVGLLVVVYFIFYMLRSRRTLKKAEAEMRRMMIQMIQVNEAKNRFLSNISSTIRKPLNLVVQGSLQLATHQISNPEEQQQVSATIRQMSASLLKMINDILDLSRLEAGMMRFEIMAAEVSTLLNDAISASETPDRKIEFRSELPQQKLFMVNLDAGRLMHIFKSLLQPTSNNIAATIKQQANTVSICVCGSILTQSDPPQEIIICNEINRMLIKYFNGTYTVQPQTDTLHLTEIVLTLPISQTYLIEPEEE